MIVSDLIEWLQFWLIATTRTMPNNSYVRGQHELIAKILSEQAAEIERLRGVEEAARGILRAATGTREEKAAFKALKQALKENDGE
jgi:hypothetical protein